MANETLSLNVRLLQLCIHIDTTIQQYDEVPTIPEMMGALDLSSSYIDHLLNVLEHNRIVRFSRFTNERKLKLNRKWKARLNEIE